MCSKHINCCIVLLVSWPHHLAYYTCNLFGKKKKMFYYFNSLTMRLFAYPIFIAIGKFVFKSSIINPLSHSTDLRRVVVAYRSLNIFLSQVRIALGQFWVSLVSMLMELIIIVDTTTITNVLWHCLKEQLQTPNKGPMECSAEWCYTRW